MYRFIWLCQNYNRLFRMVWLNWYLNMNIVSFFAQTSTDDKQNVNISVIWYVFEITDIFSYYFIKDIISYKWNKYMFWLEFDQFYPRKPHTHYSSKIYLNIDIFVLQTSHNYQNRNISEIVSCERLLSWTSRCSR